MTAPGPAVSPDELRTGSVDYIVAEILHGLHDGRYQPGQKLVETDLTREFGVGRSSVREALRKLEAEGLVTTSLHRGARIRMFSRDGIRDLFEVNEHLAGLAARLAAQRLGRTKDAEALRDIVAAMREQLKRGDLYEISRSRYRFVAEIVVLSCNQEMRRFLPRFEASLMRAQFRSIFDLRRAKQDIDYFQLVVDAILARAPERAEQAMREYIRHAAITIQQLPDDGFAN